MLSWLFIHIITNKREHNGMSNLKITLLRTWSYFPVLPLMGVTMVMMVAGMMSSMITGSYTDDKDDANICGESWQHNPRTAGRIPPQWSENYPFLCGQPWLKGLWNANREPDYWLGFKSRIPVTLYSASARRAATLTNFTCLPLLLVARMVQSV